MLSPVAHASIGSNLSVPCAGDDFCTTAVKFPAHLKSFVSGPLSIHTSCWVQSPNVHLTLHHLLLQKGFGNLCTNKNYIVDKQPLGAGSAPVGRSQPLGGGRTWRARDVARQFLLEILKSKQRCSHDLFSSINLKATKYLDIDSD